MERRWHFAPSGRGLQALLRWDYSWFQVGYWQARGKVPLLSCLAFSRETSINVGCEVFIFVRSLVPNPVYEKCRSAVDAAAHATQKISANLRQELMVGKRATQARFRQTQVVGEFHEQRQT